MAFNFVGGKKYTIAGSGVSSTASTIVLTSFTLPVSGTAITMADFGDIGYGTIEPGGTRQEFVSFTGVTQNANGTATLTGVVRGLKPITGYTTDNDYKVSHSGGASFIISNTPGFYTEGTFKRNDEAVTGAWTFPTPTASSSPATKAYVDSLVNGGTVSYDQIIEAGTAGETVVAGDLVYFDLTDNEWKKCDADTAATVENVKLGIAQGAGTNGNNITGGVLTAGLDTNQSGMTQGDLMYASNTAGDISSSTGTTEKVIGIARNTTNLYFDPDFYYTVKAREKAAMVGGGDFGTPSSTNKFVTEDYLSASATPVVRTYLNAASPATWTKPAGLLYVVVEVQAVGGNGGGGAAASNDDAGAGGGAGGYCKKLIAAASLGATETVTIGALGNASSFGAHCSANHGTDGSNGGSPGTGGTATGGDINITGATGHLAYEDGTNPGTISFAFSGRGADSMLGQGGAANFSASGGVAGNNGIGYGSGGSGGIPTDGNPSTNGAGAPAIVIVTEYFA